MASIAQEESRSISQNVTMGKRWGVQNGKVSFAYSSFLGYDKVDGRIEINEGQAEVVRLIYHMFLAEGKTKKAIADFLNGNGVPTPSGKEGCKWTVNNVGSILTNEKYKGDALLQKTYVADFLDHRAVRNEGQVAQAYVENDHPAIIAKDDWEMVQAEMRKRAASGASYSSNTVFSSRIRCECCGSFFGRKVWHKGTPYEKQIFRCNGKYGKGHAPCGTGHFTEEGIKAKFREAYDEAMGDKERVIGDTLGAIAAITDVSALEKAIQEAQAEMEVVTGLVDRLVRENQSKAQDQVDYEAKYQALKDRFDKAKAKKEKAEGDLLARKARKAELEAIVEKMRGMGTALPEWSDEVWLTLVEDAIAHKDGTITFRFKNGAEVRK